MQQQLHPEIECAISDLPEGLLSQSGKLFYSGRSAFIEPAPIYLLGLNPGGDPAKQSDQTIEQSIERFRHGPADWSDYADDSWEGAEPGTWGMQPRILHMLKKLNIAPRSIPASNLIFVRTANEAALASSKADLIASCWPIHDAIIRQLNIRTIVCLGGTAGRFVGGRLSAKTKIDEFRETNNRGWKSQAHKNANGQCVVTLTHPGRADWRNPAADPTDLVARAIAMNAL